MTTEIHLHPLCTLFPRMSGGDFDALKSDIAANGLRQPIVLHDGMILDGGNRYRACIDAGITPTFSKFTGGNLVAFVLSANLHRRHMSAGQQAAIVSSAQDWAQAQPRGGDRKSDQSATLHLDTSAKRATESGASLRTQKMADKVAKADPALAKKVAHGEISLPKAAQQIDPKSELKAPKPADSIQAENESLRAENAELRDNAREMAALVESYDSVTTSEHAAAKEMTKLRAQLRTVEATRDQWMTTAGELRKEVKALQRRLKASA